jgi:hypothetical protein
MPNKVYIFYRVGSNAFTCLSFTFSEYHKPQVPSLVNVVEDGILISNFHSKLRE